MQSVTTENQRHIPALDGVRGVAILTVMFYHFYEHFNGPHLWDRVIYYVIECGWAGVDLFFVLSGFLITRNLLDAKGHSHYFRNFYGRRILRIFPLYYLSLLVFFFLVPSVLPTWNQNDIIYYRQNQPWFWLHLSNMFSFFKGYHGFLNHFWSLAVEEQFYLFWPAVIFLVKREYFPHLCLVFCLIGITFRGWGLILGYDIGALRLLLPARFDTLAIGAFLAVLGKNEQLVLRRNGLIPLVAALFLIAISFPLEKNFPAARWFRHTFYFTTLAGIFGYFILFVLVPSKQDIFQRVIRSRFLRKCGKHSYALYIIHPVIAESFPIPTKAFLDMFHIPLVAGVTYAVTVGSVSFFASILTWELCERRFLPLKKYLPIVPTPAAGEEEHNRMAS